MTKEINGGGEGMPDIFAKAYVKIQNLRYGENPHQKAAFTEIRKRKAALLPPGSCMEKELSYNNIVDMEAAWDLACEWKDTPACVVVKHTNPCGTALGTSALDAFKRPLRQTANLHSAAS